MGILIVGLGPGPKGYITGQTVLALEKAEACYVQTALHPSIEIVKQAGIDFISLDEEYQKAQDFDALNRAVAEKLWRQAGKDVLYLPLREKLVKDKALYRRFGIGLRSLA